MHSAKPRFEAFTSAEVQTEETTIFVRYAGNGPPILMLHGFPETHLMWRDVACLLAKNFFVVCADLRGYGRSGCPPSTSDHLAYSKRAMACDMVAVMEHLGHHRFSIAGHDRGGRVAYRMALDYGARIARVAVLDVLPTETVWERADAKFALAFWPWSLLAQPEPLPERILTGSGDAIVENALTQWGTDPEDFPSDIRQAYIEVLRDPTHAHAICEEYRAAATVDREHERTDRTAGNRIQSPLLALWSGGGPLGTWYERTGGALRLWQDWATNVSGRAINAGHFFPEEAPSTTAEALADFYS